VPRDKFDSHERRFFEHRLRATGVNVRQARLEKISRKFVQHRQKAEIRAMELDADDKLQLQEKQELHRLNTLMRMRQNKLAQEDETRAGYEQWEVNMQMKAMREGQEMHYSNRVKLKRLDKDATVRQLATNEVRDGVSSFESGLLNLGLVSEREVVRHGLPEDESDGAETTSLLQVARVGAGGL